MGQPGDRTFYLQAADSSGRVVSVALEKAQVQVLADRMNELLDEVATRPGTVVPPDAEVDDLEPLTAPVDEEFRVAAMGLAWDGESQAVVVEAVAAGDEPVEEDVILSDSDEGPDALGLHLDQFQRIVVDPASVSVVTYTDTRPFVVRMNDTGGDVSALIPPRKKGRRRRKADSDAVVGGGAGATA